MGTIRSILVRRMQPKHKAMLHFILEPYKRTSWGGGGAMNGQAGRIRLFRDIFSVVQPSAIIETGTFFIGATTKFFAEFGVPVYSVEADERVLAVAKRNTRHVRDRVAFFTLSDSRSFLRKL